jgi:Cft2 family RNA processing exonuclease
MKIIIHRGTHEIGSSCVEIQSKKSRILIDIPMVFGSYAGKYRCTSPGRNGFG